MINLSSRAIYSLFNFLFNHKRLQQSNRLTEKLRIAASTWSPKKVSAGINSSDHTPVSFTFENRCVTNTAPKMQTWVAKSPELQEAMEAPKRKAVLELQLAAGLPRSISEAKVAVGGPGEVSRGGFTLSRPSMIMMIMIIMRLFMLLMMMEKDHAPSPQPVT